MSAKDSMVSRHQKPLSEMAAVIEALEVAKLVGKYETLFKLNFLATFALLNYPGMKKLLIYTDSKFLSQDHVLYKLNNCDGITGDNCNKLKHLLELTNGCDVKFVSRTVMNNVGINELYSLFF